MSTTAIQPGVTLPAAGILQPPGAVSASASLFGDLMAAAFAAPGQQGQEPAPEETAVPAEVVTETPDAHLAAPAAWTSVFTAQALPSVPDPMSAPAADMEGSAEGAALTGTTASDAALEPVVSTPEVPPTNPTAVLQPVSPNEPTGVNITDQPEAAPAPGVDVKAAGQAAPTEAPHLAGATGPQQPFTSLAASPAPFEPAAAGAGAAQLAPTAPNVVKAPAPAGPSPAAAPAAGIRPETKAPLLAPAPAAAHVEQARIVSAPLDVPVVQPVIQTAEPVPAQSPVQQGSFTESLKAASAPAPTAPAPAPAPMQTQLAKPLFALAAAAPGEHVMTVKVAPEDLGPVTVRAHIGSDGVRLEIFASGDASRDAVRAALPDLRRELAQHGLGASLNLSDRNAPSDQGSHQNQSGPGTPEGPYRPRLRMVDDAALALPVQPLRSLRSDAALDVVA